MMSEQLPTPTDPRTLLVPIPPLNLVPACQSSYNHNGFSTPPPSDPLALRVNLDPLHNLHHRLSHSHCAFPPKATSGWAYAFKLKTILGLQEQCKDACHKEGRPVQCEGVEAS